ncbi:MAG: Rne/Rng family ribonuclease [Patescibacteria group bacterium]
MRKEIVMNVGPGETRVAILEDDVLVELSYERNGTAKNAGNIYKGRVENVLPGMGAAFVDIGMERNAFLYVDDVHPAGRQMEAEEDLDLPRPSIRDVVKVGQEIIVQMVKEPIGSKGARVTTDLTLPGRYLVLMPGLDYIGVSRRIVDEKERARLRAMAGRLKPAHAGLIVRTAAEGAEEQELVADRDFLQNVWRRIQKKAKRSPTPSVLYRDHDLLYRIMRDLFTKEVDRLVIDQRGAYEKALEMLKIFAPHLIARVHLYQGGEPIFAARGIENDIELALKRRVWLDCGAYLVFDETEALSVIDVNTGKFTGTTCLEDTVVRTNLEAAKEIGRQIRLRNLGGIIIVDFIDMESDDSRNKVLAALQESLRHDKTKGNVLGFTALGLVEITRKKVRQSLSELLQDDCPCCHGAGRVISQQTLALAAERRIQYLCQGEKDEALLLALNPAVAAPLIGPGGANLARIEEEAGRSLFIKGREDVEPGEVKILARGSRAEMEALALPVREGEIQEIEVREAHVNNPADGIARIEGYIIDVEGGGRFVGRRVKVQIGRVFRTYAKGRVLAAEMNESF